MATKSPESEAGSVFSSAEVAQQWLSSKERRGKVNAAVIAACELAYEQTAAEAARAE